MKAIIACDPNGGIGYKNKLPWSNIQGDLPRFKLLTNGQTVVMGRNTWNSLPIKPLPNRTNLVLSSSPIVGATVISDIRDLDDAWIIGGAAVIESCWEFINEVHLTQTHTEFTCDAFINLLYLHNNFERSFKELNSDHTYEIWKRK